MFMKKLLCVIFLFCCLGFALSAGGSAEPPPNPAPASPSPAPARQPAPAPTPPPAPASPFFSGDGGKGLSIAILAPQAKGIAGTPDYLPALVQGEFVSNFSSYSAISVLDRQRLDDQYMELLSGYYDDNAQAGADLGHLTPTTHIMGGSVTRTATGYALQMQITKTADKMTAASYSGTCTFAELDNLSGIRRASLALLEKMGVKPTERARAELAGAAASHEINAQTALAQGITAQKSGTEIAALSYYIQASVLDGNLAEAASRLNIVTASITSGDMGADIRNDLQWRDQWVARLAECEMFFAKNVYGPYPYYLVYSTNIIEGATDYEKRTVALGVTIGSYPNMPRYRSIAQAVDTVRKGLLATGRAKLWKLDNWPLQPVAIPGLFSYKETYIKAWAGDSGGPKIDSKLYCSGYTAVVEIVNSDGKTIASSTVGFPLGFYSFHEALGRPGEFYFLVTMISAADIVFPSVDPNDITPTMAIRIAGINGQSAETWAAANSLSILSEADYQKIPGAIPLLTRVVERNNVRFEWSIRRAGLGYGLSFPLSAGEVQGETTFPMGYSIFHEVTDIMVNSIIPLYMKPPDVTLWERTTGGAKFWVIHHGVTDPQKRLDRFSESIDIGIYPSTTKSFSGNYEHDIEGPAAYLPAGNISVPVGAFLGRSTYLGANLTLTNIDYKGRSKNHPLIDMYNKNGKKEGWYVHNGYTAIQWSTLDVSHTDIYTYIPR
jgi:hypothetical protein